MHFSVRRAEVSGHQVLQGFGELDMAVATDLSRAVESELSTMPASLGFDLTSLTFIDSSGVRALVRGVRQVQEAGVETYVLCPETNSQVHRVLTMLQLSTVVPVVDVLPVVPPTTPTAAE